MPTWLVVLCSIGLLCLVVALISRGQDTNDDGTLERIAMYVFFGGGLLLYLVIRTTS